MKIELRRTTATDGRDFYCIYKDNILQSGAFSLEKAQENFKNYAAAMQGKSELPDYEVLESVEI